MAVFAMTAALVVQLILLSEAFSLNTIHAELIGIVIILFYATIMAHGINIPVINNTIRSE